MKTTTTTVRGTFKATYQLAGSVSDVGMQKFCDDLVNVDETATEVTFDDETYSVVWRKTPRGWVQVDCFVYMPGCVF